MRESARRGARPREGVPPGVGRQRLGHELRIAERPGGRSAQPRSADRRLPAQYRRRGRLALSPQRGGLGLQVGTGYFGCREVDGRFSLARLQETVARCPQIRAIEIKLSQGAKPGAGGLLPQAKISAEIAETRGIPRDRDCASPAAHSAFGTADALLDFVESIAAATGLPVGIKAAVGDATFWTDLAQLMATGTRGVDFIAIDGGEGGTAPGRSCSRIMWRCRSRLGSAACSRSFMPAGLHQRIVFVGAGRLGFPEAAVFAFGLGCDVINVGREALLAIGCIQAQRCHTNHCPTGITTQHPWLIRGLDPTLKAARLANYVVALRKELLAVSRACGVPHPALITADHLELLDSRFGSKTVADVFGYGRGFGLPSDVDAEAVRRLL